MSEMGTRPSPPSVSAVNAALLAALKEALSEYNDGEQCRTLPTIGLTCGETNAMPPCPSCQRFERNQALLRAIATAEASPSQSEAPKALTCLTCGHAHYFEADEGGFDSAEEIPWGHCKTCNCKTPNYREQPAASPSSAWRDVKADAEAMAQRLRKLIANPAFEDTRAVLEIRLDTIETLLSPPAAEASPSQEGK